MFLLLLLAISARAEGAPVKVEEAAGDRVKVASDYWRLEFDLRNGGVLDAIVFPHGSGRNLLLEPWRSYVDGWSDAGAPRTAFRWTQEGEAARLEFAGRMGAAGRAEGPVEFRTAWLITPFFVRAEHTLRFGEDRPVRTVGIGSTALRRELDEYGLRVGPADAPDARKMAGATFSKAEGATVFREHHAPLYLIFFDRNVEGFDLTTASDLATWESGLARRGGAGRYEARVAADGRSLEVVREPLSSPRPVVVRKGEYTFSYYLGLPRIVERSPRKWRHISFGNHPWPSDEDVRGWADSGVNIARLHNDYAPDENFWHDGAWPPYDDKGMTEMRRVIAACRRHNIKVVPYFSIHEFHPRAQGYAEREAEWKRSIDLLGTVFHNLTGKGEFGAQMCPQSAWLERRKSDVERAYRELGFDGIYYDWVMTLACDNKNHNARLHLGTDGVIEMLGWTRRLLEAKGGTLILHLYGAMPSIAMENFADLVVNMEEISSVEKIMQMGETPLVTVLAESIPRSPCPSYRRDRTLERNRNNIAQLVVQGMFPWSGPSGAAAEETFKLFRAFKPYRLEEYRFRDAFSGAVRTAWPDVYGAVYGGREPAVVVLSNTSGERRKKIVWTVKPEALGLAGTPAQVTVKDPATGRTVTLAWAGLQDGSLETELDGYEYRLFEIRAAP